MSLFLIPQTFSILKLPLNRITSLLPFCHLILLSDPTFRTTLLAALSSSIVKRADSFILSCTHHHFLHVFSWIDSKSWTPWTSVCIIWDLVSHHQPKECAGVTFPLVLVLPHPERAFLTSVYVLAFHYLLKSICTLIFWAFGAWLFFLKVSHCLFWVLVCLFHIFECGNLKIIPFFALSFFLPWKSWNLPSSRSGVIIHCVWTSRCLPGLDLLFPGVLRE